ncbi:MAG: TonB-dependent receptor plug domain-containing protein [Rhizobiales bacterium]|nr:TonB-dependent receptor plug domain-containing protein [Hyphomicrobiales bacterium]
MRRWLAEGTGIASLTLALSFCVDPAVAQPASGAANPPQLPAVTVDEPRQRPRARTTTRPRSAATRAPRAARSVRRDVPPAPAAAPFAGAGQGERANGPVNGIVARQSGTASKTDTPILETPQSIAVVPRQQIEEQGAQNISQALRYTSGVLGEGYGADSVFDSEVRVRGFVGHQGHDARPVGPRAQPGDGGADLEQLAAQGRRVGIARGRGLGAGGGEVGFEALVERLDMGEAGLELGLAFLDREQAHSGGLRRDEAQRQLLNLRLRGLHLGAHLAEFRVAGRHVGQRGDALRLGIRGGGFAVRDLAPFEGEAGAQSRHLGLESGPGHFLHRGGGLHRGDAVAQIVELGVAGDDLEALGFMLGDGALVGGLRRGERGIQFGDLKFQRRVPACGVGERGLLRRHLEQELVALLLERDHVLRRKRTLGRQVGDDLALPVDVDELVGDLALQPFYRGVQAAGGDGEGGTDLVLLGLDLGRGHRHGLLDGPSRQPHGPAPERGSDEQREDAGRQHPERVVQHCFDQRVTPSVDRRKFPRRAASSDPEPSR